MVTFAKPTRFGIINTCPRRSVAQPVFDGVKYVIGKTRISIDSSIPKSEGEIPIDSSRVSVESDLRVNVPSNNGYGDYTNTDYERGVRGKCELLIQDLVEMTRGIYPGPEVVVRGSVEIVVKR
jgi:hypothetical protein